MYCVCLLVLSLGQYVLCVFACGSVCTVCVCLWVSMYCVCLLVGQYVLCVFACGSVCTVCVCLYYHWVSMYCVCLLVGQYVLCVFACVIITLNVKGANLSHFLLRGLRTQRLEDHMAHCHWRPVRTIYDNLSEQ